LTFKPLEQLQERHSTNSSTSVRPSRALLGKQMNTVQRYHMLTLHSKVQIPPK